MTQTRWEFLQLATPIVHLELYAPESCANVLSLST